VSSVSCAGKWREESAGRKHARERAERASRVEATPFLLPFVHVTAEMPDNSTVVEEDLAALRMSLHFRAAFHPKLAEALQHI